MIWARTSGFKVLTPVQKFLMRASHLTVTHAWGISDPAGEASQLGPHPAEGDWAGLALPDDAPELPELSSVCAESLDSEGISDSMSR